MSLVQSGKDLYTHAVITVSIEPVLPFTLYYLQIEA